MHTLILEVDSSFIRPKVLDRVCQDKKFMNPVNDSRKEQASVGAVAGKINYREQNPLATELARPG